MDKTHGPLIVRTAADAPTVRLALRGEKTWLEYVTFARTDERDADGRPIYRESSVSTEYPLESCPEFQDWVRGAR